MLRRNREINIFSMSALDLFVLALGAFMLIALIAVPYYLKTQDSFMAQVRQAQEQLEQCREDLNRTFLVVVTKWTSIWHDIDLHVLDPQGNHRSGEYCLNNLVNKLISR